MKKIIFAFLISFSSLFSATYSNGTNYLYNGNYYSMIFQSSGTNYGSCSSWSASYGGLPQTIVENGYLSIVFCSGNVPTWESYYLGGLSSTSCPSGTRLDSNNVCTIPTCTIPLILNPTTLTCDIPSCQAGYVWDTASMSCKNSCTASQHWDAKLNMCSSNCSAPNISYVDGSCRLPCASGASFNQTDQKCYYDCSHYTYSVGGKAVMTPSSLNACSNALDSQGRQCGMSMALYSGTSGQCMLQSDASNTLDIPLFGASANSSAVKALRTIIGGLPNNDPVPIPEPQPLPKPLPANDPNYVPIPKPANDPNYVPEIVPSAPVPIPETIPAPFAPEPTVTPAPQPTPLPDFAPVPDPSVTPAPAPVPDPSPLPAPAPDPAPLPAPAPAPVVNPAPQPAPLPDVAPAPYTPPAVDPSSTPKPGTVNPDPTFTPDPSSPPASSPDVIPVSYTMPNVPDFTDFGLDDLEHLQYDFTALTNNVNGQVSNIDQAFRDTFTIINQGFPPLSIPSGTCGNSMAFDFAGRHVDLCPTLTSVSSRFAPMISLFVFFLGGFLAVKVFIYGLKD
jgi:hypothetical protein